MNSRLKIKRLVGQFLLFLCALFLVAYGCGGGGGGGDGGGTATPEFQAALFFPLTSSWETDNWTLFVDERQHDVNGTMTKLMLDTSFPTAFYWTCDDDGLRLHRLVDEDTEEGNFSPPILIAAAVARVGDKWEDTYTVTDDTGFVEGTVKVTSEIVGIEDVSVPAGNFADCFKLEVAAFDPVDDSLYWKETWYLAKNVGLVKIVNSSESIDDEGFFASKGETRQLLSYHITPSNLSEDEEAIKQLQRDYSDYWELEDAAAIGNLLSDSWSSRCRNKDDEMLRYSDFFGNNEAVAHLASISDIVVNGDEAKCTTERLEVREDGGGFLWGNWQRDTQYMKKEGDVWKFYGSHQDFRIDYTLVFTRRNPPDIRFLALFGAFSDCDNNRIEVDSFTVTGPPGTYIDMDLIPYWGAADQEYFLPDEDLTNRTNGFYTFTVGKDGKTHNTTNYLEVWPWLDFPNLVSATVVGNDVTLQWDPVDGAHLYLVELYESADFSRVGMVQTTALEYTFTGLTAATDYQWRVRARNLDHYLDRANETRSDWEYFSTP